MRTNKCAFCEEYKKQLGIGEKEKERGYKMFLEVCLFVNSLTKWGAPHYSFYSKRMRLRFRPSCGKKLDRDAK